MIEFFNAIIALVVLGVVLGLVFGPAYAIIKFCGRHAGKFALLVLVIFILVQFT